jgi:hypothetical protein
MVMTRSHRAGEEKALPEGEGEGEGAEGEGEGEGAEGEGEGEGAEGEGAEGEGAEGEGAEGEGDASSDRRESDFLRRESTLRRRHLLANASFSFYSRVRFESLRRCLYNSTTTDSGELFTFLLETPT